MTLLLLLNALAENPQTLFVAAAGNDAVDNDSAPRYPCSYEPGSTFVAGAVENMICVAATNPFGYDALGANWKIANDMAAEQGTKMDPSGLRLVGPMHIAETRAQAMENVKYGFDAYLGYLNNNQPRFIVPPGKSAAEWFIENNYGVIGTPDDFPHYRKEK